MEIRVRKSEEMGFISTALLALSSLTLTHASIYSPQILPTPPMGFNNWARYMCGLNETLFLKTADEMISTGLLAAGYNRINLDDCWMKTSRSQDGTLTWNTTLFPRGIPWLAQTLKSKGFHFGIYQDAGNVTCGGYPGSLGYEKVDAQTFSSWGIDYVKLDGCNVHPTNGRTLEQEYQKIYGTWHRELNALNPPLIFSESAPAYFSGDSFFPKQQNKSDWYKAMKWVPSYGELARHSNDIFVFGYEDYKPSDYWKSIMSNYRYELQLARYQRPGFYNDPDFLITEWPWLTFEEKKSQCALWSAFSAPLLLSVKVSALSKKDINFLTNRDIIAVDQDPLTLQATLVSYSESFDVLTKNLANGDRLLAVLNKGEEDEISIPTIRLGFELPGVYLAKDLWNGKVIQVRDELRVTVPRHGTSIFRFANPKKVQVFPTGSILQVGIDKKFHCLSASSGRVHSAVCNGDDSQVWRISKTGLFSPLSKPGSCLADEQSSVALVPCNERDVRQKWVYENTGNLVHAKSSACLTTLTNSQAGIARCGDELDSQVFSLPSGVEVTIPQVFRYVEGQMTLEA
jgi:alpha-galactosidase